MTPGKPSATAMLVARSVARRGAEHGLPTLAVRLAEQALALGAQQGSVLAALAGHRIGRLVLDAMERIVLPGLAAHHCARKAWVWRRLQRWQASDGKLVWLGVGFDGLGRSLVARGSNARVVETDHPDTLRLRRMLAGAQGVEMRGIELPAQVGALLEMCAATPTTVVCEGMLMYLPAREVLRSLHALAALPAPPRLIFSALDTTQPGGRGFRRPAAAVRRWLDHYGEPFRWRLRPDRVCRCLASVGYVVVGRWDGNNFGEYVIEVAPATPIRLDVG